jgi:hypothetical protein
VHLGLIACAVSVPMSSGSYSVAEAGREGSFQPE